MASSNNLDALFADGGLPFGHPGRRFDDTPEGFDHDHRMDQEPEPYYTPDEDGDVVHYGNMPLTRNIVDPCLFFQTLEAVEERKYDLSCAE